MATAIGSYVTSTIMKTRAGISDSTDDALLAVICDQVNSYIEETTHRILAPITGTPTLIYDGNGSSRLFLPRTQDATYPFIGGVRAITSVELQEYTGAGYTTLAAGDYFLRRQSGPAAPFDFLYLSDRPSGSFHVFPVGFATVRLVATAGWAAIPDDIADVAVTLAVRVWHARETGQQDIVGTDEFGRPVVSRFVSGRDRDTLRRYTLVDGLV